MSTDRAKHDSSSDTAVWFFVGATFAFVAAVFIFGTNLAVGLIATASGVVLMILGFIRLRAEMAARRRR